jgi:Rrf2 family protein
MSASKKLSTSVKALCYLAESFPEPKSSKDIAESIGVNASKLRKLLSMLVRQDMVKSAHGTKGGFILQQNPTEIDLQEIYCAVEDRKAFHLDVDKSRGESKDRTNMFNNYFLDLFAKVQVEIENKMKKIPLSVILKQMGIKYKFDNRLIK